MKIIKHRERIENTTYSHFYSWKGIPGSGFSFECDKNGNVKVEKLRPEALKNYNKCINGEYDVVDDGVQVFTNHYYEPAVLECYCGAEVELYGFTNTCEACERDYNMSGQLLAPREQWGEETNESLSDILRIK